MAEARWRTELRDLMELVLLPALAMVLPWRLCFRIFRRIARLDWLYRAPSHAALAQAREYGWAMDDTDWLLKRRLVTLVDHADFYLSRTRSDAWIRRHVNIQGVWPPGDVAGIVCTFHWGAGMWGLRHASAQGLQLHPLVAPLDGAHFEGRSVLHWYARARTAEVGRVLGCSALDVSASLRPVLRALIQSQQVVAAVDVPQDQVAASEPVQVLGRQMRVPSGLLRLAVERRVPVTLYLTGIDLHSGQRFLSVRTLGVRDDLNLLAQEIFRELDNAIQVEPPAWHFWSEAPRFFQP